MSAIGWPGGWEYFSWMTEMYSFLVNFITI